MKTIVITGCAGLLGSHLTRYLIKDGYKVIGIDNLSGGYSDYLPKSGPEVFEFYPLDLTHSLTPKALENIYQENEVEATFHFAAYAAEGLSPFIRNFNYTNNVLASTNMINTCLNHDVKMIFTSSMAVYGNQTPPFTESMTPQPIDPYGIAKYAVEMDLKVAGDQHGLSYTIVRPHNVIGINQNIWDRYRNVAGIFIRRILDNKPILIYGDGEQTRAFSDIKFYMKPFQKLIDNHSGETFNIGADQHFSINELADKVIRVAERHGHVGNREYMEPRHEVAHAYCDHTKAKEWLGFVDETVLEELIDEMFQWAITQPKREQKRMNYEVTKGIYDYWK